LVEQHHLGCRKPASLPEVILGSLVSVLPTLVIFPILQRYVAHGLTFGTIEGE
jgi:ABC-type glycerol-3-phosphate transport system permease component